MANATLTRNVLEMVKLLNYGMQVTEAKELPLVEAQIEALAKQTEGLIEKTSEVAPQLSNELKDKSGDVAPNHKLHFTQAIRSDSDARAHRRECWWFSLWTEFHRPRDEQN